MAGSQLGIYNEALGWLGQRKLASLAENREPRRYLDDEWTQGVNFCLEQCYWNHAKRFVKIDAEQEIIPKFGFKYTFQKPDDWVRTYLVSDNDYFNWVLRRYTDMNNFLYADITPLYFKYISNDPNFGWNMSLWTEDFVQYVSVYLADKISTRIRGISDTQMQTLKTEVKRVKKNAAAHDAMNLPVGQPPQGTWVVSRYAPYNYGGGDGGRGGDGL